MNKELIKGSTITLILSLLERKPMYGYEMIKAIEEYSNGIFSLKEGTLYPILHSIESEDWVTSYWVGEEGTRRKKYYQITGAGKKKLEDKKKEWVLFRTAVEQVMGGGQA